MSAPIFGMQFSRPNDEPVPVLGADFSKILLVETSADADAAVFPLGAPIRFSSSDLRFTENLGTGLLADAVAGVHAQLTGVNRGADITVVRVEDGATIAATAANIVAALEKVAEIPSAVNATPRLVWAGRTAYRTPDPENAGQFLASPVAIALAQACETLLAVAAIDVDDTSSAAAISARETMSSHRLMPVGIAARVMLGTDVVTRAMGPRVLGLFARVDNENDGKPFDPIANRPIHGLASLSRPLRFSLLDGSTEGQQLLDAEISIVVPGEVNVDGAVADGGFTFIGTDNADTGELWKQIHQVRAADYLMLKVAEIIRQFLGRKMTAENIEPMVNSILFMFRDHKAADDILGYNRDVFIPDQNSPENIRLGRIKLDLAIEPAPVFKRADTDIRRYRPAVAGLVSEIVARLDRVA